MSDILDAVGTQMIKKWRQEYIDAGLPRKTAHQDAVSRWRNNEHHYEKLIASMVIRMIEKDHFLQRLSGALTD